jgi:hypothetical protein
LIIGAICLAAYTIVCLIQRDWKTALLGAGLTAVFWPW